MHNKLAARIFTLLPLAGAVSNGNGLDCVSVSDWLNNLKITNHNKSHITIDHFDNTRLRQAGTEFNQLL